MRSVLDLIIERVFKQRRLQESCFAQLGWCTYNSFHVVDSTIERRLEIQKRLKTLLSQGRVVRE